MPFATGQHCECSDQIEKQKASLHPPHGRVHHCRSVTRVPPSWRAVTGLRVRMATGSAASQRFQATCSAVSSWTCHYTACTSGLVVAQVKCSKNSSWLPTLLSCSCQARAQCSLVNCLPGIISPTASDHTVWLHGSKDATFLTSSTRVVLRN